MSAAVEGLHARAYRSSRGVKLYLFAITASSFLAMGSCSDPNPPERPAVEVDTLPTGTVTVYSTPADPHAPPKGWTLREVFRVGSRTSHDSASITFAEVRDLALDSQGRTWVVDRQADAVWVFGPEGTVVSVLGGTGEGPGEFRRPSGIVIADDGNVWVRDTGNQRYVLLDSAGETVATFHRIGAGGGRPIMTEDGLIYERVTIPLDRSGRVQRVFRGVVPQDGIMQPVDTMHRPDPGEPATWQLSSRQVGPRLAEGGTIEVPFSPKLYDYVDPKGGFWSGRTDALRFIHQGPDGDTLRIVEREAAPPVDVTPDVRRRVVSELEQGLDGHLEAGLGQIPDHMPYWSGFFVDHEGRLWVNRFVSPVADPPAPPMWEVYARDGRYLGALSLPVVSDPPPVVRGTRLAGVARDELGVETVVVFALETPDGAATTLRQNPLLGLAVSERRVDPIVELARSASFGDGH